MLNEEEFKIVGEFLKEGLHRIKAYREAHSITLEEVETRDFLQPALDKYKELTGFEEENPDSIWHHRISLYGSACPNCDKPLRTPKAKLCAACGYKVENSSRESK